MSDDGEWGGRGRGLAGLDEGGGDKVICACILQLVCSSGDER